MSRYDEYDLDFDFDPLLRIEPRDDPMDFIKENSGEDEEENGLYNGFADLEDPVYASYEPRQRPRPSSASGSSTRRPSSPASSRRASVDPEYEEFREWQETGSRRRSKGIGAPLIILIILLVGGILFAGWKLGRIILNYQRDRTAYSDLASTVISTPARVTETEQTQVQVQTPSVPIHVNWGELRQQNSDVVGWLYCPNTIINYPVVQRQDEDYYLDHGFNQQPNTSGTLFADFDSVSGIQLSNFIIYGHNMKDNSMFGTLKNYTEASYWQQNPTFYYLTPNGNYRVELICAHIVESTVNNFPARFGSTAEYQSYLNQITASSFWVNAAAVNTNYQLLTLSTCTSAAGFTDARLLLHGIMIPVEE